MGSVRAHVGNVLIEAMRDREPAGLIVVNQMSSGWGSTDDTTLTSIRS